MINSYRFFISILLITTAVSARKKTFDHYKDVGHPLPEPKYRIVWVGTGTTYIFKKGSWSAAPSFDYDFWVVQNRFDTNWVSFKEMRRRDPGFPGPDKTRNQSHTFKVTYLPPTNDTVPFTVKSTMGTGTGRTDREFRKTIINLTPVIYRRGVYNTMRLIQLYDYENGILLETVELFWKDKGGLETPYMKIEEKAELFSRQNLPGAPTTY